jgi:hypothetical protein
MPLSCTAARKTLFKEGQHSEWIMLLPIAVMIPAQTVEPAASVMPVCCGSRDSQRLGSGILSSTEEKKKNDIIPSGY